MHEFDPRSLQGTVVGLLFTKTGREVKEAVDAKVDSLNSEVVRLNTAIEDVAVFIEDKEKDLEELSEFYNDRRDEKDAQARPFRRQVEEIHKSWIDTEFEFNRETERLVGDRAVVFEKGFEEFEENFAEIAELAEEVDNLKQDANVSHVMMAASPGASMDSMHLTDTNSIATRNMLSRSKNADVQTLPTEQDKAAARLNTLRSKVFDARNKVTMIEYHIEQLERETNSLKLISRHLKDEREYTLDLNSLASLGFEDE